MFCRLSIHEGGGQGRAGKVTSSGKQLGEASHDTSMGHSVVIEHENSSDYGPEPDDRDDDEGENVVYIYVQYIHNYNIDKMLTL